MGSDLIISCFTWIMQQQRPAVLPACIPAPLFEDCLILSDALDELRHIMKPFEVSPRTPWRIILCNSQWTRCLRERCSSMHLGALLDQLMSTGLGLPNSHSSMAIFNALHFGDDHFPLWLIHTDYPVPICCSFCVRQLVTDWEPGIMVLGYGSQ